MTNQTIQKPTDKVIGTFGDRQSALSAQQAIESAGIPAQKISLSGYNSPSAQVDAIGTTIGGEVGFWIGAFYGGVLGLFTVLTITTWSSIEANSTFSRLLILGFTVVGALLGIIKGKQNLSKQPIEQKEKGDSSIPQSFRITVNGSPDEMDTARRIVNEMGVSRLGASEMAEESIKD